MARDLVGYQTNARCPPYVGMHHQMQDTRREWVGIRQPDQLRQQLRGETRQERDPVSDARAFDQGGHVIAAQPRPRALRRDPVLEPFRLRRIGHRVVKAKIDPVLRHPDNLIRPPIEPVSHGAQFAKDQIRPCHWPKTQCDIGFGAIFSGEMETAKVLIAPDAVFVSTNPRENPANPMHGTFTGLAGAQASFGGFAELFEPGHFQVTAAFGDRVAPRAMALWPIPSARPENPLSATGPCLPRWKLTS